MRTEREIKLLEIRQTLVDTIQESRDSGIVWLKGYRRLLKNLKLIEVLLVEERKKSLYQAISGD